MTIATLVTLDGDPGPGAVDERPVECERPIQLRDPVPR